MLNMIGQRADGRISSGGKEKVNRVESSVDKLRERSVFVKQRFPFALGNV